VTGREDRPGAAPTDGGREILCEVTLPVGDPKHVVYDAFEDVANAPLRADLPEPTVAVRYLPVVDVEAVTRGTFEASTGVVHRVDSRDHVVVEADDRGPQLAPEAVVDLVGVEPVPLEEAQAECGGAAVQFGDTGEAVREWVTERLCDLLAEEVTYTDDDGQRHTVECRPAPDDVAVSSMQALYLPRVEAAVELGDYRHRLEYDAAGDRHVLRDDGVRRCDRCDGCDVTAGETASATYTYCDNCGSVACDAHLRTERLTGEPVCTGCAVTEEYALATNYFFDEENAATFRRRYEELPLHEKLLEHLPLP